MSKNNSKRRFRGNQNINTNHNTAIASNENYIFQETNVSVAAGKKHVKAMLKAKFGKGGDE